MSETDLREELKAPVEPLLPVEKKLIGWSLSLGLTLLAVLAAINHFFPVAL
jgi:heme/copper-type cytochrome/quinol oxidase subunit 4